MGHDGWVGGLVLVEGFPGSGRRRLPGVRLGGWSRTGLHVPPDAGPAPVPAQAGPRIRAVSALVRSTIS